METEVVTSLTAYGPGYIDEDLKDLETVVGLQTDKPLKRAFMPYGGIKMADVYKRQHLYTLIFWGKNPTIRHKQSCNRPKAHQSFFI